MKLNYRRGWIALAMLSASLTPTVCMAQRGGRDDADSYPSDGGAEPPRLMRGGIMQQLRSVTESVIGPLEDKVNNGEQPPRTNPSRPSNPKATNPKASNIPKPPPLGQTRREPRVGSVDPSRRNDDAPQAPTGQEPSGAPGREWAGQFLIPNYRLRDQVGNGKIRANIEARRTARNDDSVDLQPEENLAEIPSGPPTPPPAKPPVAGGSNKPGRSVYAGQPPVQNRMSENDAMEPESSLPETDVADLSSPQASPSKPVQARLSDDAAPEAVAEVLVSHVPDVPFVPRKPIPKREPSKLLNKSLGGDAFSSTSSSSTSTTTSNGQSTSSANTPTRISQLPSPPMSSNSSGSSSAGSSSAGSSNSSNNSSGTSNNSNGSSGSINKPLPTQPSVPSLEISGLAPLPPASADAVKARPVSTPTTLPPPSISGTANGPSSMLPLPSGSSSSTSPSTGAKPSISVPPAVQLPNATLPNATRPGTTLPSASLPSTSLPSASLPSLPGPSLPSGSIPGGSLASPTLPSASLPSASLPSASLPSASLPGAGLSSALPPAPPRVGANQPDTSMSAPLPPTATRPSTPTASSAAPTSAAPTTGAATGLTKPSSERLSMEVPRVGVKLLGPGDLNAGVPTAYELMVVNSDRIPLSGLILRMEVPPGVEVAPSGNAGNQCEIEKATDGAMLLTWTVDKVSPGSNARLPLQLRAANARNFAVAIEWTILPQAGIEEIEVKQSDLQIALEGPVDVEKDIANVYRLKVSNPGNAVARSVKVQVIAASQPASQVVVGDLAPGQTEVIEMDLTFEKAGRVQIGASGLSDTGLKRDTSISVAVHQAVVDATLLLPEKVPHGTPIVATVQLRNSGDAAARKLQAGLMVPGGTEFGQLPAGVSRDNNKLLWNIDTIPPGETVTVPIEMRLPTPGDHELRFACVNAKGSVTSTNAVTNVEAFSDLKLVVNDPVSPAAVGAPVNYEIVVTNRGSREARDVAIVAQFSEGIEPESAAGLKNRVVPGQVIFDAVPRVAAGESVKLKVVARAAVAGMHRFRVEVRSEETDARLVEEESTRFLESTGRIASPPPTSIQR